MKPARFVYVGKHLSAQCLGGIEGFFASQKMKQADGDCLVVKIALRIEQMRFAADFVA